MTILKRGLTSLALVFGLSGSFAVGAAQAAPSYCETVAGNLIRNCGFETGDFTNWTAVPAASGSGFGVGPFSNTGNYSAFFGATGSQWDQIYQVFTTITGHTYVIDFAINNDGLTPNSAVAGWFDGTFFNYLGGGADLPAYNWAQAEYFFTATTTSSGLVFLAYNTFGFVNIDDVVVRDVDAPEPLTLSLVGAGIAGISAARRRRIK
jgi:hypothetical protein